MSAKKRGTLVRVQRFEDGDHRIAQVDYIEKLLQNFARLYASEDKEMQSIGRAKLRAVAEDLAAGDVVKYNRQKSTAAAAKARKTIGEKTRERVRTEGTKAPVSDRHRRRVKSKQT